MTGITSTDIKKCFGGFVGIDYDYTDSIKTEGRLSAERCEKTGGGNTSKYLVMGP